MSNASEKARSETTATDNNEIDSNEPDPEEHDTLDELSPRQVAAVEAMGRALLDDDSTPAEVLGIDPAFIESMEEYAHLLYARDRYEQSVVLLDAVIQLDDRRYYPYLLLGEIAMQRQRFEEATACLHRADELAENHPIISARLGEALLRLEEYPAGLSYLHRAVELADDPDAPFARRAGMLIYIVGEMMAGEGTGDISLPGSQPEDVAR